MLVTSHFLPLHKPTLKHINLLPTSFHTLPIHPLFLPQIPQSRTRPSLLAQSTVKHNRVFVLERPYQLWHAVVMLVDRDVHAIEDVAADIVAIPHVDDG